MLPYKLTPSERSFIDMVKSDCRNHNITFYVGKNPHVKFDVGLASGYFSPPEKNEPGKLAVGRKETKSSFFEILAHEYGHMQQWKKRLPILSKTFTRERLYPNAIIVDYVNGIPFSKSIIDKAFETTILIEKDCDRRAIKLMEKFSLPIDIDNYIRTANLEHLSYHYVKLYRRWPLLPTKHSKFIQLSKTIPAHFRLHTEKSIPPEILKEFEKIL